MNEMSENRVFCNNCGNPYDEYKGDGNCPSCPSKPKQNCKHGMDIFNCYDGCYDEMKNGTVN